MTPGRLPTPRASWARPGDTVTADGRMLGQVVRIVETGSVPYAVVRWPTSTGRHSITMLAVVAKG